MASAPRLAVPRSSVLSPTHALSLQVKPLSCRGLRSAWNLEAAQCSPKRNDAAMYPASLCLLYLGNRLHPVLKRGTVLPPPGPSTRPGSAGARMGPSRAAGKPRPSAGGRERGPGRARRPAGSRISSDGDADPGGPMGADSARWESPPSPGRGGGAGRRSGRGSGGCARVPLALGGRMSQRLPGDQRAAPPAQVREGSGWGRMRLPRGPGARQGSERGRGGGRSGAGSPRSPSGCCAPASHTAPAGRDRGGTDGRGGSSRIPQLVRVPPPKGQDEGENAPRVYRA